jgi:hypothetical protein
MTFAIGESNMALTSCSECGNQVSNRASNCPKCGCPLSLKAVQFEPKKMTMSNRVIFIIIGALVGLCFALFLAKNDRDFYSAKAEESNRRMNEAMREAFGN